MDGDTTVSEIEAKMLIRHRHRDCAVARPSSSEDKGNDSGDEWLHSPYVFFPRRQHSAILTFTKTEVEPSVCTRMRHGWILDTQSIQSKPDAYRK